MGVCPALSLSHSLTLSLSLSLSLARSLLFVLTHPHPGVAAQSKHPVRDEQSWADPSVTKASVRHRVRGMDEEIRIVARIVTAGHDDVVVVVVVVVVGVDVVSLLSLSLSFMVG